MNFKQLRTQLKESGGQQDASSNANIAEIENCLNDTKKMLDDKRQECEEMRQDLHKRLGDSAQFRELKSIIAKKNSMIKELRTRLSRYEVDDTPAAEED